MFEYKNTDIFSNLRIYCLQTLQSGCLRQILSVCYLINIQTICAQGKTGRHVLLLPSERAVMYFRSIFDFGFQGDLFFVASLSLHSVNSPLKLLNSKVLHLFETTLYSLQSHKINPYILRYLYHLALKWSRIVFKYWASYKLYTNLTSHSMFFNAT